MNYSGSLRKMKSDYDKVSGKVTYYLNLDNEPVCTMNDLIGSEVSISFAGKINCTNCGRGIRKAYGDGLCYPCLTTIPQGDMCILKPQQCHFHKGTCRDEEWGKKNCFIPHTLYLARSSTIKIGITRHTQQFIRWVDQGATEAVKIGTFPSRREVGIAEVSISEKFTDKTNWRKMLTNVVSDKSFEDYFTTARESLSEEQRQHLIEEFEIFKFEYPVQQWPEKVTSLKLDKVRLYSGVLTGIKGQYLMFGNEVINLRAHSGYGISLSAG